MHIPHTHTTHTFCIHIHHALTHTLYTHTHHTYTYRTHHNTYSIHTHIQYTQTHIQHIHTLYVLTPYTLSIHTHHTHYTQISNSQSVSQGPVIPELFRDSIYKNYSKILFLVHTYSLMRQSVLGPHSVTYDTTALTATGKHDCVFL